MYSKLCYLSELLDIQRLQKCREFIFDDPGMRENNMDDVIKRVNRTFASEIYVKRLTGSRQNWLGRDPWELLSVIQLFLQKM